MNDVFFRRAAITANSKSTGAIASDGTNLNSSPRIAAATAPRTSSKGSSHFIISLSHLLLSLPTEIELKRTVHVKVVD